MSTLAPFAALEDRVNADVLRHLANAEVFFNGADERVAGIFDNAYEQPGVGPVGMAGTQPAVAVASHHVPRDPVGQLVFVRRTGCEVPYAIAAAMPDGTGLTALLLERR